MEAANSTAKVDLRAIKWLFEPADPDSFLRAWRMKSFLHFAGASGRFDHLVTWSQLGTLLEQHRMTSPRLVLFKKGQKLDQHLYLEPDSKFRSEYRVRRQMITELEAGATLILNHFDDFNTATQELAQEFEWALRTGVHANLYAGWGADCGFDLHQDEHDALILQVAGKKRWTIYRPKQCQRSGIESPTEQRPTDPPIWDDNLEDGSLLYIPKGWWHLATPQNEPTLHLTVTISNSSGIDFLQWVTDLIKSKGAFSKELPHLASEVEIETYLTELLKELTVGLSPNFLARYLAHRDAIVKPRPHFNLSIVPFLRNNELPSSSYIRLAVPRKLRLIRDDLNDAVRFEANNQAWTFTCPAIPALTILNDYHWHAMSELQASSVDPAELKRMLIDLVFGGGSENRLRRSYRTSLSKGRFSDGWIRWPASFWSCLRYDIQTGASALFAHLRCDSPSSH